MRIFLVYRSGGEYTPEHVFRLSKQIKKHNPTAEISVLTDKPSDVSLYSDWTFAMRENYPGWWSKMELFKFKGPLLYMDLDTTVLGPLDDLWNACQASKFAMLRDFYSPSQYGSGLMGWSGKMDVLLDRFREVSGAMMTAFKRGGDQAYVEAAVRKMGYTIDRWQELVPDQVFSYKAHIRDRAVPPSARVVCFHGKPRPWEVEELA